MSETIKISATIHEETVEWLRETYPDSLSDQEAIRMAISDARTLRVHRDVFLVEEGDD